MARPNPDELAADGAKREKQMNQVRMDIVKKTYGQNSAGKDFVDFTEHLEFFKFDMNGIISKPTTIQAKKSYLLLFINNRLVESEKIKRSVDTAYQ